MSDTLEKLNRETGGSSKDVVANLVDQLRPLIPEAFADGKIDFDVIRESLGDYVDDRPERYSFNWHGKSSARRIAQTPSTGALRPCHAESVNWDSTGNLFIEGDNLEVLKLLQKSYHKRVDVIYIDPPYNTGKEFIYPDKYQDNLATYLKYTGQVDAEGFKTSANTEASGRYHTNWLNMMLPRLKLARNLLAQHGVILISIDEHESFNLRHIANEVFGEENFIAELVWEKTRKNDAKLFSVGHDYIFVFAKDLNHLKAMKTVWREPKEGAAEIIEQWSELCEQHGDDYAAIQAGLREWYASLSTEHPSKKLSRYKHVDKWGPWRDRDISWPGGGGPDYDVIHPDTGEPCAVPESGWRYTTLESMQEQIEKGFVVFREDHTKPPFRKAHLLPVPDEMDETPDDDEDEDEQDNGVAGLQVMPSVIYKQAQVESKYLKRLFGAKIFDNPKDHEVLARLIRYVAGKDALVLDFFCGSASTADAVLRLNADDGGARRFVMVQLPEPCSDKSKGRATKLGFENIADIGKERIRKVIQDMGDSKPLGHGFRVFKLDSSNIHPWDAEFDNLEDSLLEATNSVRKGRSDADVLYELLLKFGLDLAVPIEERDIAGNKVFIIGAGALVVSLADEITLDVVEGIAALKDELRPEVMRVVLKDAGFQDDVVKTNAVQILRQRGIEDVKSL